MQIEYNQIYLLDDLELKLIRITEGVHVFEILNRVKVQNIHGNWIYPTCIIKQRLNELKLKP